MDTLTIDAVERPWGRFRIVYNASETTVKILEVEPGQAISLQRHRLRDEFWTLLDAGLRPIIQVGDEHLTMSPDVCYAVPAGTVHRILNPSMSYCVRVLEVIKGRYDENDIVRLGDKYGR